MIKQGLDYDGNVSLVWLFYRDECMKDMCFQGAEEINVLCGYKTSSCVSWPAVGQVVWYVQDNVV